MRKLRSKNEEKIRTITLKNFVKAYAINRICVRVCMFEVQILTACVRVCVSVNT